MMLRMGEILNNRYEIIEFVDGGGMASVYKAKDHRLNRLVAIKVLNPQFGEDRDFVRRFDIEAQLAASLSDPNVVNIYDFGDEGKHHFIVMEYVDGVTLKEYITSKGRLDIRQAVELSIQIASGIQAAHNNKITHRDIKPKNILVVGDGETVKVTDFGIAKSPNMGTIQTTTMGSVQYLSPEQAKNGYTDERTDIYSFGITMYEMVVGRVPFDAETNVAIALMHIQDAPTPPRQIRPEIPESLEQIILKCMEKRKDDRYQSMTEVIDALKQVFECPGGKLDLDSPIKKQKNFDTVILTKDELNKIKNHEAVQEKEKVPEELEEEELEEEEIEEEEDLDDEDSRIDPKIEKIIVGLSVVTALIILSVILYFVIRTTGIFSDINSSKVETTTVKNLTTVESEKVTQEQSEDTAGADGEDTDNTQDSTETADAEELFVPSVVGLKKDEAAKKLQEKTMQVEYEYKNSNVEKDYVTAQSIKAGTKIGQNSLITLTISQGRKEITVPKVVGMTENQARETLAECGLNVEASYIYSDTEEKNQVMAQSIEADSTANEGDNIGITVSLGKAAHEVTVPDLSYYTEEEAKTQLERLGLELGSVTNEASDTVAKGQIISQSVEAKTKVSRGTEIDVVISSGVKESKYVLRGNIVLQSPPFSTDEKENANLTLTLVQNGEEKDFYDGLVTAEDFPLSMSFEGIEEGAGVIYVKVDGEQQDDTYIVQVNKVEK